jgi:alpha-beta hydrolase superfamily lysophospholipase
MGKSRNHFLLVFLGLGLFNLAAAAAATRLDDAPIGRVLQLPVTEWRNDRIADKAIIVGVHGLTFYANAFDDLASHLADCGYPFYAADLRGFGRWKTEYKKFHGDNKVHFTQSEADLVNLLKELRRTNPTQKIYCVGESLGANYALWIASTNPDLIDGVIACSPCVKRFIHPRLRWGVDFWSGLLHPKTQMNLEPYINPYLSHDKKLTKACLADPKICRRLSPVELVKTSKTNKWTIQNVRNIPPHMPILILAGQKDRVFKTRALPTFVAQLGSKEVVLKILKGKGHLLFEHQPIQSYIGDLVDPWLDAQTKGRETIVRAQ